MQLHVLHPDHEVDVAIINHADPLFLRKITERCRLLYGSAAAPGRAEDLCVQALPGPPPLPRSRARVRPADAGPAVGPVIDAALVGRKALLITRDLADLARLAQKPLTEYLTDPRDELVAERLLERIIGRMIDVNYHLLIETDHHLPRLLRLVHSARRARRLRRGVRAPHRGLRGASEPDRPRIRRGRSEQGSRGVERSDAGRAAY